MSVVPATFDLRGANVRHTLRPPLPTPAALTAAGAAGAAVSIVLAANAASPNVLSQLFCSLSAAASTTVTIQVLDAAAVIFTWQIGTGSAAAPPITFDPPMSGTVNQTMTIQVSAPGGSLVAALSVNAYVLH